MFMIQAVAVDSRDRVDRVQWQAADTQTNQWVGAPSVVRIIEVVDRLNRGDRVGTVFPTLVGTTQGPWTKVVVDGNGKEWVETDTTPDDRRTLLDLPRMPPLTRAHDDP